MGKGQKKISPVLYSHLGLIGLVVITLASWELLVPWLYGLEPAMTSRLRFYPLFIVILALVLLVANHLLLHPLFQKWPRLLEGKLGAGSVRQLVGRALSYPFYIYLLFFGGGLALSLVVAVVQAARLGTPLRTVVILFLAVAAHMAVLSALAFGLARVWVGRLLKLPARLVPPALSQPDLKTRLALGMASVAAAAWLLCSGQMLMRLCRLASVTHSDPCQHPVAAGTIALVDIGGLTMLALAVLAALMFAADVRHRLERLAGSLRMLAEAEEAGTRGGIPVSGADELDELVAAFNDLSQKISERAMSTRQAVLDVREADRRQLELINVVCHNLRTPLHSITGFSQLLLEDSCGLSGEQHRDVAAILRSSHHLLGLVDDIVDLTKMESGLLGLNRTRVELAGVVREALEAGAVLGGGVMKLQGELSDDLPPVWADETRLRQILLNLISNAVKYAGRGMVVVRAEKSDVDFVRLSVEDDGPGLPEEYLGRIFQEFEQAARSHASSGTGLGLAITKQLVELHGGKIWAGNRPGGGASFSFSLPVWTGREAAA